MPRATSFASVSGGAFVSEATLSCEFSCEFSGGFSGGASLSGAIEPVSNKLKHISTLLTLTLSLITIGYYPYLTSRTREGALPLRSSSGISSIGGYQKQKGIIIHNKNDKAKAEAWEKAKLQRIQKRYEKMKLQILSWEGEKRIQAKIQMERKKNEMDHQRENVIEHYKRKIARLDMIGQRAIKELEDQRRKQELKVKEKANKIKKTGRVPVTCFCFKSL
ncbi:unnamed protein product [Vicia faba]|uniref:Remorin C-terminal domain-containing protein n=1 Tax=Vicia faba TaxID=3906 RepID=A0AAV1A663_VICFA|nr:unnamed protein product [Vicia faba]